MILASYNVMISTLRYNNIKFQTYNENISLIKTIKMSIVHS